MVLVKTELYPGLSELTACWFHRDFITAYVKQVLTKPLQRYDKQESCGLVLFILGTKINSNEAQLFKHNLHSMCFGGDGVFLSAQAHPMALSSTRRHLREV